MIIPGKNFIHNYFIAEKESGMIRIHKSKPQDFLEIAVLDRRSWRKNRNSKYIPDGEHAWRLWAEHALVCCARKDGKIVGE
jgi:phosphinothricin acetyltransferase